MATNRCEAKTEEGGKDYHHREKRLNGVTPPPGLPAWYTALPVRDRGLRTGEGWDAGVRWIAIGLIVIGVLLLLVSLFADTFGIGAVGSGFGWKQLIGTMLGAGLCLGGARGWWEMSHMQGRGTEREG